METAQLPWQIRSQRPWTRGIPVASETEEEASEGRSCLAPGRRRPGGPQLALATAAAAALALAGVFLRPAHVRASLGAAAASPQRLLEDGEPHLSCDTKSEVPSWVPEPQGQCNAFKQKTDNCNGDWQGKKCGACFNAGARAGVMCRGAGGKTGYMCPPQNKEGQSGDIAFACMDWTFGSSAMRAAEGSYNCRSGGPPVYFGVGTYGVSLDQDGMGGLGMCVKMHVVGVDREIIAQSLNTGHDVAGNQFDLQMGAGGVGLFNTCAGDKTSMYPGPKEVWGKQYGGLSSKKECGSLPPYPRDDGAMKAAGESLVGLCEYAFDRGVYENPSIASIGRVPCPAELVNLTQFRRSDEPQAAAAASARRLAAHECRLGDPGVGADWCLTRMMDCRKPSGAIKDNVMPEKVVEGHRLVQPCTADGYTRIDVQCGCHDCYC